MFYDLHPRDRNEPTIVLVTLLAPICLEERNGRLEAVVVLVCGKGDTWGVA